jgi:endonuclease-8
VPEGDAVYKFAARVGAALAGKAITAARAHGPGSVPQIHRIVGATCTGARAKGKNLIISFDNGLALRGHLRMYGTWHIYAPGAPWTKPQREARLVLEAANVVVVNFSAPVIELLEERALEFHRPIASLGPNLLDEEFDVDEAIRRFRDPAIASTTIGDAIMDQQIMAGVGNIWKHETLFRCGLNPWRRIGELDDGTVRAIVAIARNLLLASTGQLFENGRKVPRPSMFVYMRASLPCRKCFTRIRSAPQGRDIRSTAWCPNCQPAVEGQAVPPPPPRRSPARATPVPRKYG